MRIKNIFLITILCLALTSCVSGINPSPTQSVTAPALGEILNVLMAANPTGYCANPGDTTFSFTMPDCTWENVDAANRVHEMTDLPVWLAFDATTLTVGFASGITAIPDYTAGINVTYTCYSATDNTASDTVTFNIYDCDGGGIIDRDEINLSKPPLIDNTIGYISLDDLTIDIYSPPYPTGIYGLRGWALPAITDGLDVLDSSDDGGDLEGDGILTATEIADGTNIFVWTDAMSTTDSTINLNVFTRAISSGDFNNDGYNDIVIGSTLGTTEVSLWDSNTNAFDPIIRHSVFAGVNDPIIEIAVADFNRDNLMDIAASVDFANDFFVAFGDGAGNFTLQQLEVAGDAEVLTIGDFDSDGYLDIAIINEFMFWIYLYDSSTNLFVFDNLYNVGGNPQDITTVDVNGDNILDIVVTDIVSSEILIYFGVGDGTFTTPADTYALGNVPVNISAADFNNDGFVDIASSVINNVIAFLLNDGDGTFTLTNSAVSSNMGFIAAGDFNGDNLVDLAMGDTLNDLVIFGINNGNLTFTETPNALRAQCFGITVTDINRNNRLDIAATDWWGGVNPWAYVYIQ